MAYVELTVEGRDGKGSMLAQKLRRSGYIPAVVYSGGEEAIPIMVKGRDFVLMAKRHGHTQLFKFKSDASSLDGKLALVKSVQTEPIKETVLHIDFLRVEEGHRITVEVPIEITGECPAVKEGKALLNQTTYELEVECLPGEIPGSIKVDVSGLREGQSIHASDLVLPETAVLKSSGSLAIVSTVAPKMAEEQPAAAAEGEAVPGAATTEQKEAGQKAE